MKIALIGPGIMPIPPTGWGAVESLIWDYKENLEKKGHEVIIINTPDRNEIIRMCNDYNYDFIHIHYDVFCDTIDSINNKNIAITSHYPYIDNFEKHIYDGYSKTFNSIIKKSNENVNLFLLSKKDINVFVNHGTNKEKVFLMNNGASSNKFLFNETCERSNDSIYLAKIEDRKNQFKYQNLNCNLYFAGNLADNRFNSNSNFYLGELSKGYLYNNLTNFANLVLLSNGEAHPLVCLEAMCSGLGIVISETSASEFDTSKPFITVIPKEKMEDHEFIKNKIIENREISINMRKDIKEYFENNFSWDIIVDKYIKNIENIINK